MSEKSILVVEDNPTVQKLVMLFAKRCGVQAEVAGTTAEALAAVSGERRFDIILMDWTLPDGNGLDCTGKIRDILGDAHAHSVPIVAMTANLMEGDREMCLASGMDDFLGKPFSLNQFCEVLTKWAGYDQSKQVPYLQAPTDHPHSQSA